MCSSSAIGWFSSLSCGFSAYKKEKVAGSKVNNVLGMIHVSMNLYKRLGLSVYFMCVCVFTPHDRATLRYCQSWSDSSEPATSHSAVPHTQGQQCHYLLLHTVRQGGTEQHMCNFIADTILTHITCPCTHAHSGLSGITD